MKSRGKTGEGTCQSCAVWWVRFMTGSFLGGSARRLARRLLSILSGSSGLEQPTLSTEALGYDQDGDAGEQPDGDDRGGVCQWCGRERDDRLVGDPEHRDVSRSAERARAESSGTPPRAADKEEHPEVAGAVDESQARVKTVPIR